MQHPFVNFLPEAPLWGAARLRAEKLMTGGSQLQLSAFALAAEQFSDRADFNTAHVCGRNLGCDLDCIFHVRGINQIETCQIFFRLREGTIRY
jgi:hypothetical protein